MLIGVLSSYLDELYIILLLKLDFFILLHKFAKIILKQFNFQQKHIRFIFYSVFLQKIETYCDDTYKCTYIG